MNLSKNKYWYLASYPKSGNTWCRLFIRELYRLTQNPKSNFEDNTIQSEMDLSKNISTGAIISDRSWFDDQIGIDSEELTNLEVEKIRIKVHNQPSPYSETLRYHKVHDAFLKTNGKNKRIISTKNCAGIVYIIRNPIDIVISMESFFGWSKGECIKFIMNPNACLSNITDRSTSQIIQYIGTWEHHVNSWTNQNDVPLSVFRYEDFLQSPLKEFTRLSSFLQLPINPKTIEEAVENCSFKKLREKERNSLFIERSKSGNPFFRYGKKDLGLKRLSKNELDLLKNRFRNTLHKFDYTFN
ncbi:sulfotransferase domain-containing protein [Prochlorococcus marinus XMU1412]|uniref:sulfotransferase domain-containing protein n=1 Tax=Prochlorococcus marinus TaxID=1219 RepID=UPI001ADA2DC4|nr:sulfotransferase domain-containing protein [Prochlorococcus marinus]MBO8240566.1 sulfotransferase domain-containing protein [Prochlorococcus marinus XMU1412]MBW3071801.1 hypothetical protein [Prochlorococcus marinus str. MU1412]